MNSIEKKNLQKEVFLELLSELKTYLIPLILIVIFVIFTIIPNETNNENQIEKGMQYTNQCKLIEVNINNGFLSPNTNKISCRGIIYNIATDDYNDSILAYQNSLKQK